MNLIAIALRRISRRSCCWSRTGLNFLVPPSGKASFVVVAQWDMLPRKLSTAETEQFFGSAFLVASSCQVMGSPQRRQFPLDEGLGELPEGYASERLFVLAPLADLASGLRPPGWGETVGAARRRAELREGPAAVRPMARWDRVAGAWDPLRPPA